MRLLAVFALLSAPAFAGQVPYDHHCNVLADFEGTRSEAIRERARLTVLDRMTWILCDNWAQFTEYDRDHLGVPRAAKIQIGQFMDCVRRNLDSHPITRRKMLSVRETLRQSLETMREGDVDSGSMMIYTAVRQLNSAGVTCHGYTDPS